MTQVAPLARSGVPARTSSLIRLLEDLCSRPDTSAEDRSRRGYFVLCILITTPVLAGYAAADLAYGRLVEASATLALVAVMAIVAALMSRLREVWSIFRITTLLAVTMALYWTATGGGDGLVFVWFYIIPLIVFFLFGGREGTVWVLASFVALALLFFGDLGLHPHDPAVSARFLVTYGIVSVLGFGLEASRQRSYHRLLAEKSALEEALVQARTLSGLLPICVACKSVRDDQGYWSQIETYLRRHTAAELSQSLCPECRERSAAPAAASRQGPHASFGR